MLLEQACGQCFKVKIKQCENPHSAKKKYQEKVST